MKALRAAILRLIVAPVLGGLNGAMIFLFVDLPEWARLGEGAALGVSIGVVIGVVWGALEWCCTSKIPMPSSESNSATQSVAVDVLS